MTEYKSQRNTLLFLVEEDVVQEITVGFQDEATPDNFVGKTGIRRTDCGEKNTLLLLSTILVFFVFIQQNPIIGHGNA